MPNPMDGHECWPYCLLCGKRHVTGSRECRRLLPASSMGGVPYSWDPYASLECWKKFEIPFI